LLYLIFVNDDLVRLLLLLLLLLLVMLLLEAFIDLLLLEIENLLGLLGC